MGVPLFVVGCGPRAIPPPRQQKEQSVTFCLGGQLDLVNFSRRRSSTCCIRMALVACVWPPLLLLRYYNGSVSLRHLRSIAMRAVH